MTAEALVAAGYLAGSIPFGILVSAIVRGVDPRRAGSGNVGATNVARVAGKVAGLLVLALDALKGLLPVLYARFWFPDEPWTQAVVGAAAVVGHVFPVWLRFRGGKGVATSLGATALLAPWAALAGVGAFALTFLARRIVSLASLAGAAAGVVVASLVHGPGAQAALTALAAALIGARHVENIRRLRRGEEPRF